MLNALIMAPTLLAACKSNGVLQNLRSVCREARTLATSAVSSVTLRLGDCVQLAELELLPLMQLCTLTKLTLLVGGGGSSTPGSAWSPWAAGAPVLSPANDM